MLSKPLAFGLVAAACVAAAGGGAYIATLQHARHDSAMAAADSRPAVSAAAQPQSQAFPQYKAPAASDPPVSAETSAATAAPPVAPAPSVVAPPAQPSPDEARPPAARKSAVAKSAPRAREPQGRKKVDEPSSSDAAQSPAPAPGDGGSAATPQVPAPIPAPTEAVGQQQPRPAEKTWEEVTVPEDAVVGLQLETPLTSDTARVEDRVDARVTRDVRANGLVAIPAGTHAIGTVTLVERGGKIRDRARLGIRFNSLVLPDNTRVSISTDAVYREGEPPSASSSKKIGGGAIGGAIIGAILGGGKGAAIGTGIGAAGGTAAAMAGDRHPIVLPVGTSLSVRTQAPITITVEK